MNPLQKLADIHSMITYIKEHVSAEPITLDSAKLDEIGQATLVIAGLLESIKEDTGKGASERYAEYVAQVNENAEKILEQLKTIKDDVDSDKEAANELYRKIEEVYVEDTGILEKSTKTLELQREHYSEDVETLTEEVSKLLTATESLDKKTMNKKEMLELLSGVETQLTSVIEQDKALNDAYERNSRQLQEQVNEISQSCQSLNQTLLSVNESFTTAVSRLDVLLMQVNVLRKGKEDA